MILEALASLTSRAAPGARGAGLVHGQAAMIGRWLRHRAVWRTHLENCRAFIRKEADACAGRDCAVVLGSGPLFDVPLAELSRRFQRVVLVDAVQPLHALLAARRLGNVEPRLFDLVEVGNGAARYRSWRSLVPSPDFVVASMLLSQLPLRAGVEPTRAGAIVAAALADLDGACIVTETARVHRDAGGAITAREDPLFGISRPHAERRWTWPMAPIGEVAPGVSIDLEVAAFRHRTG